MRKFAAFFTSPKNEHAVRLAFRVHLGADDDFFTKLRTKFAQRAQSSASFKPMPSPFLPFHHSASAGFWLMRSCIIALRFGKRFGQIRQRRVEYSIFRNKIDEFGRVANARTCDALINVASQFR